MSTDLTQDWTAIVRQHMGKWVALADDERTVIASAITAKEALTKSAANGLDTPLLYRVPDTLDAFVGYELPL